MFLHLTVSIDIHLVTGDAQKLSAELLRLLVVGTILSQYSMWLKACIEAINRAEEQARADGDTSIKPEHFEKIAPQLLLDM